MPKYYCDYCDKRIQETRKLHDQSESHKRNKAAYYASFSNEYRIESFDWKFVDSHEEKIYYKFLEKKVLSKLYSRFQNSKI